MLILIVSFVMILFLLKYYFELKKEKEELFTNIRDFDYFYKDTSQKKVDIGVLAYFILWFAITSVLTYILIVYSRVYYKNIENILFHDSMWFYFGGLLIFPSLFFVSNIFEALRIIIPIDYTMIDPVTPVLYNKKNSIYRTYKYHVFIIVEIVLILIVTPMCYLTMNTYIYYNSDEIVVNRFLDLTETHYSYNELTKIDVSFELNGDSIDLDYKVYFGDEKIDFQEFYRADKFYMLHKQLINHIGESTTVNYTTIIEDRFNMYIRNKVDDIEVLYKRINEDFSLITN